MNLKVRGKKGERLMTIGTLELMGSAQLQLAALVNDMKMNVSVGTQCLRLNLITASLYHGKRHQKKVGSRQLQLAELVVG